MQFQNSPVSKQHSYIKKTLPFGEFYFFNKFIISEINEGIHLSWEKVLEIINLIHSHYGENCKISYITNRTNSYSFDPNLWVRFYKEYNFLIASASISYSEMNFSNSTLEKLFAKKSLKRANSLEEAIDWVLNLDEYKG